MSMNLFFRAFTSSEVDAMQKDRTLIDAWVESGKYSLETDIETAWDVLMAILNGLGFRVGTDIDDALFNGCTLITVTDVQN